MSSTSPGPRSGSNIVCTSSVFLTLFNHVLGALKAVKELSFGVTTTITISWAPPFSLNLTTAEPDIQYCVDVYNVTVGGDDHLQSVCDITDTYYTFTVSDPDQLFNFKVTPRSNVEGSLNGTTSQPVQGYILGGISHRSHRCTVVQLLTAVPLPIPSNHLTIWSNADLDPIVLSFSREVYEVSLSLNLSIVNTQVGNPSCYKYMVYECSFLTLTICPDPGPLSWSSTHSLHCSSGEIRATVIMLLPYHSCHY